MTIDKIVYPYPNKVKESRTIVLDEGVLWDRIDTEVGRILSSIHKELGVSDPYFNDDYEDERHEAISLLTTIFKGCIDFNLNDSETEVFWKV